MYAVLSGKRVLLAACAALAIAAALVVTAANAFGGGSVETSGTNWGLGFRESGKPPTGNAAPEFLAQYDAYFLGDTGKNTIYLTFDAGYESGHTASILDTLKKHDVKAAFFLVGNYLKTNPELVRRMCDEGHLVGNHTYHHPDMSKISDLAAFKKELSDLEDLFRETTGAELPKFYRPPQGKYSVDNLAQAKQLGYKTILWSLAYVDWYEDNQPTRQQAFDKLIPRIHPGAVVLLHSTSSTNADILDELLGKWKELGYTFGTLNEFGSG